MAEGEGGDTGPRSVDDIQLVPGHVAVRKRPHLYFGDENELAAVISGLVQAMLHDWSRHLAVHVRVFSGRSAEVSDNGVGISTDLSSDGTSFLETMITTLPIGPAWWWLSPCSAVCSQIEVETSNDDGRWRIAAAHGEIVEALTRVDDGAAARGTRVRLTIDPNMFVDRVIPSGKDWLEITVNWQRSQAQHNPRATVTLHDLRANDGPEPVERPEPVELGEIAEFAIYASDVALLLRHIDYRWELDRPSGDDSSTDRSRRLLAAAGGVVDGEDGLGCADLRRDLRSIDSDLGESDLLTALADALPERLDREVVRRLAHMMAQSA